jgi:two-component system, NarL family, response regulator DegU
VTIRLLLADDHRMLREGLRRSMVDEGFDVVGEAENGEEAVDLVAELHPDVVLMDVTMPEMDGVEATRRICAEPDAPRVVMLTMHADKEVLAEAIRAGASGYLTKDSSTDEVADAVKMAANGETVLSPAAGRHHAGRGPPAGPPRRRGRGPGGDQAGGGGPPADRRRVLHPRGGRAALHLQKTVKNHLASIYQKLDARDRTQAVLQAVRMGIVQLR